MTKYCSPCEGNIVGDCNQIMDSRCIYYNPNDTTPSQLMCFLNVANNTSVHDILETLDEKLCEYLSVPLNTCFRDLMELSPTDSLTISEFLVLFQEYICTKSDEKVKVSANDPEAGYLYDKITVGEGLQKEIKVEEDGSRSVHITINPEEIYNLIKDLIEIPNCYEIDCTPCEEQSTCTPQPLTPIITKNTTEDGTVILSCTSCNGVVTWYNEEDEVIAYGSSTPVSGGTYYATSETTCGVSGNSNTIVIPNLPVFSYTRTTTFTRNNCPTNGCGLDCIGSSVVFSKTYISYISQAHAQQLANTDATYSTQGQSFANQTGTCECPSCECIQPMYTNAVRTNPTCNGVTLQSNGTISITGITNANKFGISFDTVGYTGQNYTTAYSLGYSGSNIASTTSSINISSLSSNSAILRLFNNENNCYRDLVFTFIVPSCEDGDTDIELGLISVSCDV